MALVLTLSRDELRHPLLGALLVGLALVITATATARWRDHRHHLLPRPALVTAELVVGAALVLLDGVAWRTSATS